MIEKKCLMSFGCFVLVLLICLVAMHIMQLFAVSKWVGICIGGGIIILTCVLYFTLRKNNSYMNYVILVFNSIAGGIIISSLFVYLGQFPEIWQTVLLFVFLCILFFLYCLCTKLVFFQKHYIISMILYFALLLIGGILGLVLTDNVIYPLALILLSIFLAYLISLVMKALFEEEHLENIVQCSFVVICVLFVVLLIISESDAVFDGTGFDVNNNKKNYNPYSFKSTAFNSYTTLNL